MSDSYMTEAATAAVQATIDSLWSNVVEPLMGKAVQEVTWRQEVENYGSLGIQGVIDKKEEDKIRD